MIFNGIKRRWMRKVIAEKQEQDRNPVIWPKSAVIICEHDQLSAIETFYDWAHELKINKQNVTILCAVKDVKKDIVSEVVTFDRKLFKWSGGFNDLEVKNILDQSFDLQLNYYRNSSEMLDFMASYMRSRIKVGCGNEEDSLNDLTIHIDPSDHKLFIKELKKYLSILTQ